MVTTTAPARIATWTLLLILVTPGLGHAYLDPTAGGFLLQLVLGGATGLVVFARLFARRLSEKVFRRLRGGK